MYAFDMKIRLIVKSLLLLAYGALCGLVVHGDHLKWHRLGAKRSCHTKRKGLTAIWQAPEPGLAT